MSTSGEGMRTAPPLTSRVGLVLLGSEWFKLRKRLAFWLTLGFFTFVDVVANGEAYWGARNDPDRTHALPEAWSFVLGEFGAVLLIFASVALILLVSSEFSWRTARQNVIDGFSKTQWFWGKTLLLPVLGLVFLAVHLTIGGGFALAGTDLSASTRPIVPFSAAQAAGGLLLGFLVVGALALFLSVAIRSSGPAMAAWFFWIAIGERQIVAGLLARAWPGLEPALRYLPWTNAQRGIGFEKYDAPTFQRMVEAARDAERTIPVLPDMTAVTLVNMAWVVLFVGVAFVWFRRRDL